MNKAQEDVQNALSDARASVQHQIDDSIKDAKDIKPEQWGVAVGIALLISIILGLITKQKEDSFITAGTIIYALVVGALAVFLRNQPLNGQFQKMVLILSILRCLVEIAPITLIVFSFLPFLVNSLTAELKNRGILKI